MERHRAELALEDRENLLQQSYLNIESNLQLLGATGIEDKLQTGVPEAIASLQAAGMKIWVLTGDKQETAINIGFSSHLIHPDNQVVILNVYSLVSFPTGVCVYSAVTPLWLDVVCTNVILLVVITVLIIMTG